MTQDFLSSYDCQIKRKELLEDLENPELREIFESVAWSALMVWVNNPKFRSRATSYETIQTAIFDGSYLPEGKYGINRANLLFLWKHFGLVTVTCSTKGWKTIPDSELSENTERRYRQLAERGDRNYLNRCVTEKNFRMVEVRFDRLIEWFIRAAGPENLVGKTRQQVCDEFNAASPLVKAVFKHLIDAGTHQEVLKRVSGRPQRVLKCIQERLNVITLVQSEHHVV